MKQRTKTGIFGVAMATVMGLSCFLGSVGGAIADAAEAPDQTDGAVTVSDLEVNGSENPLGIDDAAPVFSWQLSSAARGKSQSAYQIVVKNGNEIVWDSGKTSSENNYGVLYDGETALRSKTKYDWTVTVWDETDTRAGSASSSFETGLMSESDWKSDWIGEPSLQTSMDFGGANWIWGESGHTSGSIADNTTRYFRRAFTPAAGKTVERVQIAVSADDYATIYLNGEEVLSTPRVTDAWKSATVTTLSAQKIASGENVFAAEVTNYSGQGNPGYAGLLAKIEVYYTDGSKDTVVSDTSWKWSASGEGDWNGVSFDETGWTQVTASEGYGCNPWGTNVSFASSDRAALMLRKEFAIDAGKTVEKARVYMAGLGLFDLKINGENPDDSVLNPANTDYDDTVLYNVFDVTELLQKGENAVFVELGNGFYNESLNGWNWANASWRATPRMRFELDITYTDGSSDKVYSDTSWKVSKEGAITDNSIYRGETIDARKYDDYASASYDDGAWQNASEVAAPEGTLTWQDMEPMRRMKEFTGDAALDVEKSGGTITVKVERMITGWSKIVFRNTQPGQTITIDYGETLANDGTLNKKEEQGVFQRDVYICKGVSGNGTEVYEPKFNYKGFQYVQISGYDGTLTADDVTCYLIHNDVAVTGSVKTSNELLNELHALMTDTLLNNFQGKPTDTPWLEKNGWLGDVNVALRTMGYNFDIARFMTKFLRDIYDAQEANGNVPQVVPISGWGTTNSPIWNSVYIFAVQELADTYGMGYLISEYYDSLKALADLDIARIRANNWLWDDVAVLGDWVSPLGIENSPYNENPAEGSALIATAFVYQMLGTMSGYAEALGKTQDKETFESARENILAAFNAEYLKEGYYDTNYWNESLAYNRTRYRQTSNLLPLAFGMVPEESVEAVVKNLVDDIVSKDYHLDTGVIGTKYILPVLCDYGYSDVAYRILTQVTYPSWGYWLTQGATSLWEMWESTARSHNHYFLGTYDEWFYSYLGGIRNVKDGYRTFTLDPLMAGDLTNASVSVETVRGELSVAWSYAENNRAKFTITVPFGSTAELFLPTADANGVQLDGKALSADADGVKAIAAGEDGRVKVTLGGGTYEFECGLDKRENYYGSLAQAVRTAESYAEEDYRAEGWTSFAAALGSAKSVLGDSGATQLAINDAVTQLSAAMNALQAYVNENRVALKALIEEVKASDVMEPYYTAGALNTFRTALNAANAAAQDKSLTEEDMAQQRKTFEAALDALLSCRRYNLAKDRAVAASSSVSNGDWDLSKLVDGNTANRGASGEICGWSSDNLTKEQHEEWVQIDLGFAYKIDKVVIYTSALNETSVAYGMPRDFVIEVSEDGEAYTTVVEEKGYSPRVCGEHTFRFESVRARYIRIRGTSLNQIPTDGNQYRMQFAEVQIFNTPSADMSAVNALIERYNALERGLYTTDSLLALEDAMAEVLALQDMKLTEEDQTTVDAAAEKLKAALDGLALKPSAENPGTDPGTEPSDPAPAGVNVGAIVGGVVGGVAGVAIIAAVVILLLRRRNRK